MRDGYNKITRIRLSSRETRKEKRVVNNFLTYTKKKKIKYIYIFTQFN